MKRFEKLLAFALLSHLAFSLPIAAQSRPKAPALIRDTDKAEGKEDPDTNKQKEYSPLMADKSIKVGNFYLKKKNYVAAIERYKEAIEYQPDSIEACEAMARAYEKNGDLAKAAEAYKDFIRKNPESLKISECRTKLARLEKKQS